MSTVDKKPSMNEASDRDPYNNNSYGTLVDQPYKQIRLPILDVNDFNDRTIRAYEDGSASGNLPADLAVARSVIPAGTATLRDFSYVAPEIPIYIEDKCTGCGDCVEACPKDLFSLHPVNDRLWAHRRSSGQRGGCRSAR